jgi:transposase
MAKEILSDERWGVLDPLLPAPPPRPKGGRRRIPNRAPLTGLLSVLKSGLPWELLPQERGCGSGLTCGRRLAEWQAPGVWQRLHHQLLDCLGEADQIGWERAAMAAARVPAPRGARRPGRLPRIAAKRARSAMCWSTGRGSRGLSRARGPTSRISSCWNRRSLPLSPASGRSGGPASGPLSCLPIRPTMRRRSARPCGGGASRPGLRGGGWNRPRDWGVIGGWSNGRMPGSTAFVA